MERMDVENTPLDRSMAIDVIGSALKEGNITDTVILSLREKYGSLKIRDHEDKEGYDLVKKARLEVRKYRTTAQKICKAGRDEAIQIQKKWIEAEKDVTTRIRSIEEPLELQEQAYEQYHEEQERLRLEKIQKEQEERERLERVRVESIITRLASVGKILSFDVAKDLTDEQIGALEMEGIAEIEEKKRIAREEQERIEAEKEQNRIEREKLELEKKKIEEERKELASMIKTAQGPVASLDPSSEPDQEAPYVKPKVWTAIWEERDGLWTLHNTMYNQDELGIVWLHYLSDEDKHREAAERIAAIYEEVQP